LLIGIGVGLLIGLFLHLFIIAGVHPDERWQMRELASIAYGAPVVLFGGLGLLIAFIVENNLSKKKENEGIPPRPLNS
jgi:hypothetical protein